MLAVARSPDFKAIEDFDSRHKSSLEYVKMSKEFLSTWLGVPESIISDTPRDKCLDASEKHYIKSTQDEDAWLAFVVSSQLISFVADFFSTDTTLFYYLAYWYGTPHISLKCCVLTDMA